MIWYALTLLALLYLLGWSFTLWVFRPVGWRDALVALPLWGLFWIGAWLIDREGKRRELNATLGRTE